MACFSPLQGWRARRLNEKTGARSIVFNMKYGYQDMPQNVPCGNCMNCRLDHARVWAVRCMHEASLHERNCFITLTYNDKYLPDYGSLNYDHFKNFMKRLRKRFGEGIRFYAAGEYGDLDYRPHYHACIFNFDFAESFEPGFFEGDRYGNVVTALAKRGEHTLFQSSALDRLWTHPVTKESMGYASVGTLTFESANYTARYVTKKMKGPTAHLHYIVVDDEGEPLIDKLTGEIVMLSPEKPLLSNRPGIGSGWYDIYREDTYKDDTVIVKRGDRRVPVKPPKYYDKKFKEFDPLKFEDIRIDRLKSVNRKDNTLERLRVKEQVKLAQIRSLKRSL